MCFIGHNEAAAPAPAAAGAVEGSPRLSPRQPGESRRPLYGLASAAPMHRNRETY